jgi:hypothetical protein
VEVVDAWSPYPVHGIDDLLGIRPTRLPYVTLVFSVIGVAVALWLQYWTSASSWPLDVGGKPFDSLPAFVPVAFELLVLFGGLATAFALLARSRLGPGRRPKVRDPRLTDDRFALMVHIKDARLPEHEIAAIWRQHGAVDTWTEVGE